MSPIAEERVPVVSFTKAARLLSLQFDETVTRQRVYEWWKRATRNAAGEPFPREVWTVPAPTNRPRRHFDYAAVLAWIRPGVPALYGDGWRHLGQ